MVKIHKTCFDIAAEEHCIIRIKTPTSKKEKEKHANASTVQLCYISAIIMIMIMIIEKEESGINKLKNLGLKTIIKLLLP